MKAGGARRRVLLGVGGLRQPELGGGTGAPAHQSKQRRNRAKAGEGRGEYFVKEEEEGGLLWRPVTMAAGGATSELATTAGRRSRAEAEEGEPGGGVFVCVRLSWGKQGKMGFKEENKLRRFTLFYFLSFFLFCFG